MSADFDAVERAIIAGVAVMAAFGYGAFDAGVAFGVHNKTPFVRNAACASIVKHGIILRNGAYNIRKWN